MSYTLVNDDGALQVRASVFNRAELLELIAKLQDRMPMFDPPSPAAGGQAEEDKK